MALQAERFSQGVSFSSFLGAPLPEEGFELFRSRFGLNATFGFRSPMAGGLLEEFWTVQNGATFGVVGSPDHPSDARMTDCTGAHGARFQCYIQSEVR